MSCSLAATAQMNELSVTGGGSFTSSSTFDPGMSGAWGAQYDRGLFYSSAAALYIDVPFVATTQSSFAQPIACSLLSQCQNTGRAYFITPGVKLKLAPKFPISPYIVGGIGWAHYQTANIPILGSTSANHLAYDIGGGLDIKIFPHVSLRGEVRDFISTQPSLANSLLSLGGVGNLLGVSPGKQNNIVPQVGLVFRW
jgi:opacity protein-like surface antigen